MKKFLLLILLGATLGGWAGYKWYILIINQPKVEPEFTIHYYNE